jgi:hypothetical protein
VKDLRSWARTSPANEQCSDKAEKEPHCGVQGEGGLGGVEGRQDAGAVGREVRRAWQPDHAVEGHCWTVRSGCSCRRRRNAARRTARRRRRCMPGWSRSRWKLRRQAGRHGREFLPPGPGLEGRQLHSIRLCAAGTATSNMLTGSRSPQSTALFAGGCGRCCAGRSTDRVKDDACAITTNGQMSSSLTLGCSRCMRPIAWRANPDVETTDWRARRGRTAQRVRREGTAIAVPYPYPSTQFGHCGRRKADAHVSRESIPHLPSTSRAQTNRLRKGFGRIG